MECPPPKIIKQECYFSFWITIISAVLSIAFYFIPLAFLTHWALRLVAWGLFGPWMKLLDIYWYSKLESLSEEEKKEMELRVNRRRTEGVENAKKAARTYREDAYKLKEMKQYLFGQFLSSVKSLKMHRHHDIPLPSSTATPIQTDHQKLAKLAMDEAGRNRTRVTGQTLIGDMVPVVRYSPDHTLHQPDMNIFFRLTDGFIYFICCHTLLKS